jgi:hypothetical protein
MRLRLRIACAPLLALALNGCGSADPELREGASAPEAGDDARPRSRRAELDLAQVVFALRGREEEFAQCVADPHARGHVRVRWKVTPSGEARNVRVLESTSSERDLVDCVKTKVAELKFPRARRSTNAQWTFVFGLERAVAAREENESHRLSRKSSKRTGGAASEPGIAIDAESPGFLEPSAIENVVQSGFRLYAHCYRDGLARHPRMDGAVRLKFVIAPEGSVEQVVDLGSDLPDQRVINCVAEGFFALQFPKPERGRVHVLYRMLFEAS